jgi:hypothetical protein
VVNKKTTELGLAYFQNHLYKKMIRTFCTFIVDDLSRFSDVMAGLESHSHLHQQSKMNNTATHQLFTGDSGVQSMRGSPVTSLRIAANRPAVPLPTGGQNMIRIPADHLMVSSATSRTLSSMSGTVSVQQSHIGSGQSKMSAAAAAPLLDPLGGLANQQHMMAASQSASSISAATASQQQQRYQELLSQRILNNQRLAAAAGEFPAAVQSPSRPSSIQAVPGVGSGVYRAAGERMGVVQTLPRNPPVGHQQQQQLHLDFSNQE